jgi:hypothetical protein
MSKFQDCTSTLYVAADDPACDTSTQNGHHFQGRNGVQRLCREIKLTLRQVLVKREVFYLTTLWITKQLSNLGGTEWYMFAERASAEWRCRKIHSTIRVRKNMNLCHKVHHSSHVAWTGNRKDEGFFFALLSPHIIFVPNETKHT